MQPLHRIEKISIFIGLFLSIAASISCKKLVDVQSPATEKKSAEVNSNDPTAIAVQTGLYENMMNSNSLTGGGIIDMSFYPALSADELSLWSGNENPVYIAYY